MNKISRFGEGKLGAVTVWVHRDNAGYTQKQLAEMIGVSVDFIDAIEKGKETITKELAIKIGEVLDYPYERYLEE